MVLTRIYLFYLLVKKKEIFCGAMMGQKTEYDFRFKKDSI